MVSQKALYLDAKFGSFKLGDNKKPSPAAGQLLVKATATALNPVDWKIQKYGVFVEEYPAIIGTDIAGVVEEVGTGVTGFAKGDKVVFQGAWAHDLAGYQQYTLTFAETTAKVPAAVSVEEAVTIPVAGAAAVAGFYLPKPHGAGFDHPFEASGRGKYAGKPVVVLGGATSVGQFAIQFARLSGFSPIIATASLKHEAFLKSLGATNVIDRNTTTLGADVAKITSTPLDIVFDAVASAETQGAGLAILAPGGTLVTVLATQAAEVPGKDIVNTLGIWTFPHSKELGVKFYSKLHDLLADGSIKPNRVEVLSGGLNAVVDGLKRLETDQVSGVKLVIRPNETA